MTLRRFFPVLLVVILTAAPVHAQSADSLILRGKRLLQRGYSHSEAGTIQQARALFLRVAEGDSRRAALGRYYAGLSGYRLIPLAEGDEDRQLQVMNDAIAHLETAIETAPKMADAHALLSALYGWKAGLQWYKAMFLGPRADDAMARAKKLAPQNPRVVFLNATGLYNKPSMFGGDKEKALKGFERAARLAAQETASGPLAPSWGRADALAWAGVAHMNAGRPDEARTAFRKALRVNPDFGWVKDVLMPQLAESSGEARE